MKTLTTIVSALALIAMTAACSSNSAWQGGNQPDRAQAPSVSSPTSNAKPPANSDRGN